MDYALVMVGPSAVNKTTVALCLCRMMALMMKCSLFLNATTLNDYGPLSLKGLTAQTRVYCFDDCSPKSGPAGGKLVDEDEAKQLFGCRFGSSYTAMYAPAQFGPCSFKVFTSNVEKKGVVNGIPSYSCSPFAEHFRWICHAVGNDAVSMKQENVNMHAQARRCAVLYLDETPTLGRGNEYLLLCLCQVKCIFYKTFLNLGSSQNM